ncbi:MAG: GNAT family N-acetyltransferase [Oscillospiraceae bacterium]|jgi:GNAT superfamily N-acetyltransferase|nr:GNAT family N-acetyltransferase [Oscillospiraceae bacterium]
MTADMEIRLDALDAQDFAMFRRQCGLPPLEPILLRRAIDGSLFTLLALCAEPGGDFEPAGMLRVVGDGAFVFIIYDVMVVPAHRNAGIGSELIRTAISRVRAFFPPGRWLTVNLFAGPGRDEFYTRLGFYTLPNSGFGPGMQVIVKS